MAPRPSFLCVFLVAGAAGVAAAAPTAQLGVAASSGYTDNALGAPRDAPAGVAQPDSDIFFNLNPTLRVWDETPRLVGTASLGASLSRYVSASQANSLELHGALALDYELGPTTHGSASLTASYLDVPTLVSDTLVGAVPTGGAKVVTIGSNLGVARDLSRSWRVFDELKLSLLSPIGDSAVGQRVLTVSDGAGTQFSLKRDAFEVRVDGGVSRFSAGDGETAVPGRTDITLGTQGSWSHELDPFWGVLSSAGVGAVISDGNVDFAPLASVVLSRVGERFTFHAGLSQTVHANLLLAQTLSTTDATVGIVRQIGDRWAFTAASGAAHSRVLGGEGPTINGVRFSARADLRIEENFALSLSYDFLYQVTSEMDDVKLLRNTVLLGVTAYYPRGAPRQTPLGIGLRVRQSEERDRQEREGVR